MHVQRLGVVASVAVLGLLALPLKRAPMEPDLLLTSQPGV